MNKLNDGEKEIIAHYKNLWQIDYNIFKLAQIRLKNNLNSSLLDPSRLHEFDNFLKSYAELLFKWELYNKRIEILELLHEKPDDLDDKFGKFVPNFK